MFYVLRFILRLPFFILFPTFRKGGRVKHKGRGIVIANHQSAIDIIVLCYAVRRKIHFMAKESLFKRRFLGWLFRRLGGFPVNRENVGITTVKTALGILKDDKIMAMFPEGTRSFADDGEVHALKNGVATFALKTKSPIIPTYIVRRPKLFRFNKIVTGKAFELTELYDKKIDDKVLAEASRIITEKLKELRDSVGKGKQAV